MKHHTPMQTLLAYDANDLRVTEGANFGDVLSFADELILDDVYTLSKTASLGRLSLASGIKTDHFTLTADTKLGSPGADLYLDCCITLMAQDGHTLEALIFVEVEDGAAEDVFLHPLAQIIPDQPYRLVGLQRDSAIRKMAEVACVSFSRGTHITLANGAQVQIENIQIGDRVLTRNEGPQAVRWIGQNTVRAVGEFAPVLIRAGSLNNANDLMVSPDHRLFIYQRSDQFGAGRSELLVKARYLVNDVDIIRMEGGFVDYYQILFDGHQIIYAEGIAAESMLIDTRTEAALPDDLAAHLPNHSDSRHQDYELQEALLGTDMAARLKAASAR